MPGDLLSLTTTLCLGVHSQAVVTALYYLLRLCKFTTNIIVRGKLVSQGKAQRADYIFHRDDLSRSVLLFAEVHPSRCGPLG